MTENSNFIPQLVELVVPPQDPIEAEPPDNWEAMKEDLGTTFPEDLLTLIATYGSGRFKQSSDDSSLTVFNPFSRRYLREVTDMQTVLRYHNSPFDLFPCSPGLLCWGVDSYRDEFCWFTDGVPNAWPIIVIQPNRKYLRFDTSLSGFLVQLVSGEADGFGLGKPGDYFFEPANPWDPSRLHPLFEAVVMLDRKKARQLLNEGVDPNTTNKSGETALFAAIDLVSDAELVKMLLAAGADPNVRGEAGRTPLQLAASSDYAPECMKILLTAGAEVSPKDDDGWSALLWACSRKFEERVRLLLAHGADPNDRLPDGRTALQLARQSDQICERLRAAGATE